MTDVAEGELKESNTFWLTLLLGGKYIRYS